MSDTIIENSEQTSTPVGTAPVGTGTVALKAGRGGIIGVKAGMTQVFEEDGTLVAVTVIDLPKNVITAIKDKTKHGYTAVQVGVLSKKASKTNKSELGRIAKLGREEKGFYHCQEIRLPDNAKMEGILAGMELSADFIKVGDLVDITARSKGKGFQGGMKRYHMAGGHKTHGASVCHRSLGSICNRADPGKTFKLKKMPGQMGNERTTTLNIRVAGVDLEKGIMLINGSIPGPRSGFVVIRKAVKNG